MKHLPYILIILVAAYFLFRNTQENKNLTQQYHDIELERDSISAALKRSIMVRDSLSMRIDSLLDASQALTVELEEADEKLKNIPGKFDKLTNRELEAKMIEEWQKRGN